MNKAFTLIELLVVIAIIAILAAILFPVFAQAKLAAKGAAALSNVKQDTLAEIMYQNDFDDNFVLSTAWNTGNDPVCFPSAGICASSWVWLVQPYQKNADIDNDPMAPGVPDPAGSGLPTAAWISIFNSVGYNYGGLSPYIQTGTNPPGTQVVNSTSLTNPAGMPMFSPKDAATEMTTGTTDVYAYGFSANTDNGPLLNEMIERPYCNEVLYCLASWGYDVGGDLQGQVDTLLSDNILAGARTGRSALRAGNQGIFSFTDGHAKKMAPGAAAVGTNFAINQSSDLTVINNPTTYMWTVSPGSY